jgi:signal recognition particle receptor subunit beta
VAEIRSDQSEINARIVYWGIPGAGISANLAMIHGKLKASNRGDLKRLPTRIDPTVEYQVLPIELGKVNGVRTRLHVIGVPGGHEQAPTRKQLLDRIDGAVFVADSRPECIDANIASLRELLNFLADYGHTPGELPFVIQYNKCDLVDPFVIERLHREIQIPNAAVYEASAKTGTGILKTLTTISKLVIRQLGKREASQPEAAAVVAETLVEPQRVVQPAPEPSVSPETPELTQKNEITESNQAAQLPPMPGFKPVEPDPEPDQSPGVAGVSSGGVLSLMEAAILAEAADDVEADAALAVASEAQAMLDQPWDAVSHQAKPEGGAHIGADLRIVSVGEATRVGDRGVSVPLVLGNNEGETVTLALTIQLDPLLDSEP